MTELLAKLAVELSKFCRNCGGAVEWAGEGSGWQHVGTCTEECASGESLAEPLTTG
jgi:hypothetical protein